MKQKQLIIFCLGWLVVQFFSSRFILDYSFYQSLFNSVFSTGFFAFVTFYLIPKLAKREEKKLERSLPSLQLLPGEIVLLAAPANSWNGVESIAGKLTLTDKRLIFRSLNSDKVQDFDHASIASVNPHPKLERGIELTSAENTRYIFLVHPRRHWIKLLNDRVIA